MPFLLGAILALWLFPHYAPADTPFTSFALFMGVAMSITAFPVLARILTDRKMEEHRLGVVALSCAAIDDVTAWCLLAFVVGVAQAEVGGAVQTILYALGYIAIMLVVVRPLAIRYLGHDSDAPQQRMAVWVLVALLFSALTAEWIGIHAIFGAFLLGAIIPHDTDVAHRLPAQARRHREDSAAAGVLRLHRHADGDRPGLRLAGVGLHGGDHPRRHARQVRRHAARPHAHRPRLADCRRRSASS